MSGGRQEHFGLRVAFDFVGISWILSSLLRFFAEIRTG